jgi:hypothetical protein
MFIQHPDPADKTQALQKRIDSVESKLAQTYDG